MKQGMMEIKYRKFLTREVVEDGYIKIATLAADAYAKEHLPDAVENEYIAMAMILASSFELRKRLPHEAVQEAAGFGVDAETLLAVIEDAGIIEPGWKVHRSSVN